MLRITIAFFKHALIINARAKVMMHSVIVISNANLDYVVIIRKAHDNFR